MSPPTSSSAGEMRSQRSLPLSPLSRRRTEELCASGGTGGGSLCEASDGGAIIQGSGPELASPARRGCLLAPVSSSNLHSAGSSIEVSGRPKKSRKPGKESSAPLAGAASPGEPLRGNESMEESEPETPAESRGVVWDLSPKPDGSTPDIMGMLEGRRILACPPRLVSGSRICSWFSGSRLSPRRCRG